MKNAGSKGRSLRILSSNASHSNKEKNNIFHEAYECASALGLNHQEKNLVTDSKYQSVAYTARMCMKLA